MLSLLENDTLNNYTIPDFSADERANLLTIDYSTFANTNLSSVTINSVTYSIDQLKIELNGNNFTENFGGSGKGIVNIQGALRLNIENGIFERNGENCNETYNLYRRVTGSTVEIGPEFTEVGYEYSI